MNNNLINPAGWRILIKPIEIQETVGESGLVLPSQVVDAKEHFRQVGEVVALGPLAYKHGKFIGGDPWCQPGDWIVFNSYAGISVEGKAQAGQRENTTYKLINDDEVLGVTNRPADIKVYCN